MSSLNSLPVRRFSASRTLLASVSMLLVAGLATGCGASAEPEAAATPTPSEEINFSYEDYTATIPGNPQRVVVLDSRAGLEMALLAGYPIVATAYDEDGPLSPMVSADAKHLKSTAFELDREEIASYNPDLIVVGDGWGKYYDGEGFDLGKIAPVLQVNGGTDVSEDPTKEPFKAMTDQLELLERTSQSDAAIAAYETSVAEAKEKIGAYTEGKTASVIHAPVDNFNVISDEAIYEVVLPALGFSILENDVINDAPAAQTGTGHVLSYENAVKALGDADMLMVYKADEGADLDPVLKRVPAVEDGNWIDGNLAQRFGFALTYKSLVDDIVEDVEGFEDFSATSK